MPESARGRKQNGGCPARLQPLHPAITGLVKGGVRFRMSPSDGRFRAATTVGLESIEGFHNVTAAQSERRMEPLSLQSGRFRSSRSPPGACGSPPPKHDPHKEYEFRCRSKKHCSLPHVVKFSEGTLQRDAALRPAGEPPSRPIDEDRVSAFGWAPFRSQVSGLLAVALGLLVIPATLQPSPQPRRLLEHLLRDSMRRSPRPPASPQMPPAGGSPSRGARSWERRVTESRPG